MDSLERIRIIVENKFKVDIMEPSRRRIVIDARRVYCMLARKLTDETFQTIGAYIDKHHTTVMHMVNSYDDITQYDLSMKLIYDACLKELDGFINGKDCKKLYDYHLTKARKLAKLLADEKKEESLIKN